VARSAGAVVTGLRIPRVDALNLASMLGRFNPSTVVMLNANHAAIREQLADHMIAELGLNAETADRFYAIVTSPFYAERVTPDELQERADAIHTGDRAQDVNEGVQS
jgi:hypothetical protein